MEAQVSQIIPSYPFVQYRDDPNVVAFFQVYNEIAQEYLDEINSLSIPYWPSPALSGKLLDWVVEGIYGESRPLLQVSQDAIAKGAYNTIDYNTIPYAGLKNYIHGATTYVVDDYFKRILTWNFYKGDGVQFNIDWLKRRIARFLRGPNGIDPPVTDTFDISVISNNGVFAILLPNSNDSVGQFLKDAIEQRIVKLPFMYSFTVDFSN
ncbi:TPA: hypothetical protein MNM60_000871 [Citrobacter freundii]|uniref:hypothetical protein n=1 Tax=Citrobacter freundii TaxID=546 RepID=UPI0032AEC510|nr:hypothetical protein [Citrobacter freundii]HCA1227122.1 hypothetical protein [Citrobacter freundii]HCA1437520.1 hypothetical protein [Citrobacter freundii]HCA1861189.1 hypothetical protein [Citrobacter freundii]HCA2842152.1 hypothetical protein [Citrobacter freundii]